MLEKILLFLFPKAIYKIEKILCFLFPKTINRIINDSMKEAEIIYHYGSMENYYQMLDKEAEEMKLEHSRNGWYDE